MPALGAVLAEELLKLEDTEGNPAPIIGIGAKFYAYRDGAYHSTSTAALYRLLKGVYSDDLTKYQKNVSATLLDKHVQPQLVELMGDDSGEFERIEIPRGSIIFGEKLIKWNGEKIDDMDPSHTLTSTVAIPHDYNELLMHWRTTAQGSDWHKLIQHHFEGKEEEEQYFGWWCLNAYFDSPECNPTISAVLQGKGATGKTVLTNAILEKARQNNQLARYAQYKDLLGKNRFNKAKLTSSLFAYFQDTGLRGVDWGPLKSFIDKDEIDYELKGIDEKTAVNTCSFIANTNSTGIKEIFAGKEGFSRRIFVVELDRIVPVNERDAALGSRLATFEGQRDVWAWMVACFEDTNRRREKEGLSLWGMVPETVRIPEPNLHESTDPWALACVELGYEPECKEGFTHQVILSDYNIRQLCQKARLKAEDYRSITDKDNQYWQDNLSDSNRREKLEAFRFEKFSGGSQNYGVYVWTANGTIY